MDGQPSRSYASLPAIGCLLVLLTLCLLPWFLESALGNLHLSPNAATLVTLGILFGGLINLPIYRFERHEDQLLYPHPMQRLMGWAPVVHRRPTQTIIALNVGGCVIPLLLAVYELQFILASSAAAQACAAAVIVNCVACYWAARPVPGVGIAMPGFLAPLAAVGVAWLLLPSPIYHEVRPPVAFVAGIAGPLIGADLFHLRDISRVSVGMLSIGGAGTFDGIVLSGLLAALLA